MIGRRLKILMIAPRFGTISRGVEVFVTELAKRVDKNKFEVSILSGPHDKCVEGVTLIQYPLLPRERFSSWVFKLLQVLPARWHMGPVEIEALSLMISAKTFLRTEKFDVVLPFGGTWTYRFARKCMREAAVISVGHGGPVLEDLKLTDYFVALTPADQLKAEGLLPSVKSCVIPNGVDTSQFHSEFMDKEDCSDKQIVLCVGALTADKRHDLLFDAVERLSESIQLVCAGDGPQKGTLMKHSLYKEGRVHFISKPHAEMPKIYRMADVFTLASPEEAFGLVFLEALATGLPVVAHDAPRQRFVIGESGFFCDVYDQECYSIALTNALDKKLDSKGIKHAQHFDWHKITAQYQAVFKRVC